jgi:excisionase family DNA binding protein
MTEWLTIHEAAKYAKVSERTIRNWMKGGLKYSRIGGLVRIDSMWIDEYLNKHLEDNDKGKKIDMIVQEVLVSMK